MVIARELVHALREAGHEAGIIVTPQNRFGRQASAYLATWMTDVTMSDGQRIDQVISLRFPSYAVRHERHVCWLNHTMREYYDLWDRFSATLGGRARIKERVRRAAIHAADHYLLARNVDTLFVQSKTIQQRLAMWQDVKSTVLYPPAPHRPYRCDQYGDAFLFVSRLTPLKRADLVVEALTTAEGRGLRLVIVGDGEDRPRLERLIAEHQLHDRVTLLGRVDERQMLELYARCLAVVFPPVLEDYGFVTVEAFASRKAVVTCRDSGGPTELVADGVNGFIAEPTAASLATAMRRLADDGKLAERLGSAAFETGRNLNWSTTVARLTS